MLHLSTTRGRANRLSLTLVRNRGVRKPLLRAHVSENGFDDGGVSLGGDKAWHDAISWLSIVRMSAERP